MEHLLSFPALELTVLAGADGLHRSVSWAHASELLDPTPWLLGAEVITTTGLAVPRDAAGQRACLERLDDTGVSALAVSAHLHTPPLHTDFLAAADERGLPVLKVPLSVMFVTIVQEVAAALTAGGQERLGRSSRCSGRCAGWPPRTSIRPRSSAVWSASPGMTCICPPRAAAHCCRAYRPRPIRPLGERGLQVVAGGMAYLEQRARAGAVAVLDAVPAAPVSSPRCGSRSRRRRPRGSRTDGGGRRRPAGIRDTGPADPKQRLANP